ncbi:MAG: helix-turn-helix transcriptional regulator [Akkermansiaceae bacterium]|nr:helix-turn-helix transcriptional regulator [Akkermansiaceae bacterium]
MDYTQSDTSPKGDKISPLEEISQIRQAFAKVLATRRLRKRWSQVELGGHSGLDNSYISRLEKGQMTPTLDVMLRLSKAFEIVPERLMKEVRIELENLKG